MRHKFYDHHRLVETAKRYDLEIADDVDTKTAICRLLELLKREEIILAHCIGFVQQYLRQTYPDWAPDEDVLSDDDDDLAEYDLADDDADHEAGDSTVVPFFTDVSEPTPA